MDILEKKYLSEFSGDVRNILSGIRFKDEPLFVIGSSSYKQQKYFSDYDVDNIIMKKYKVKEAYEEFSKILEFILNEKNVYFIELKLQKKNDDKIKKTNGEVLMYTEFSDFYKDKDFVKIDLVLFFDNRFIEFSINYKFNGAKKTVKNVSSELSDAVDDEIKDKNYIKAVKRYLSNLIIKKSDGTITNEETKKIEDIITFLNGDVGLKYKTLSNLKTIELLKEHYDNDFLNKKIKLNLDDIHKLNFGTMKTLDKDIQNQSKKFLNKIL